MFRRIVNHSILTLSLISVSLHSPYAMSTVCQDTKFSLSLASGYSKSNTFLNFFSDGQSNIAPGIDLLNKQEFDRRENEAWQWAGAFRIISKSFYLRSLGIWGDIQHGSASVQLSQSFSGIPAPGDLISQTISFNKSATGDFYDVSAGVGYPFRFLQNKLMIAPLIGYAYAKNVSHETVLGGTISQIMTPGTTSTLNILSGIDTVHAIGREPFIGVDIDYDITNAWKFYAGYDFHPRKMRVHEEGSVTAQLINPGPQPAVIDIVTQNKFFNLPNTKVHNLLMNISYKFTEGFLNKWAIGLSGSYNLLTTASGTINETDTRETIGVLAPTQTVNETLSIKKLKVTAKGIVINITRQL